MSRSDDVSGHSGGGSTTLNIPADLKEKWLAAGVCPANRAANG